MRRAAVIALIMGLGFSVTQGQQEKQEKDAGWKKLFDLNKNVLDDANVIYPGQLLHLS